MQKNINIKTVRTLNEAINCHKHNYFSNIERPVTPKIYKNTCLVVLFAFLLLNFLNRHHLNFVYVVGWSSCISGFILFSIQNNINFPIWKMNGLAKPTIKITSRLEKSNIPTWKNYTIWQWHKIFRIRHAEHITSGWVKSGEKVQTNSIKQHRQQEKQQNNIEKWRQQWNENWFKQFPCIFSA